MNTDEYKQDDKMCSKKKYAGAFYNDGIRYKIEGNHKQEDIIKEYNHRMKYSEYNDLTVLDGWDKK